jgi:hypothetical protein
VEDKKDRFAQERFENTEPETDDVEGHRLANETEDEAERNAEPDVEAHQLANRGMDRNLERGMDRNIERNADQ